MTFSGVRRFETEMNGEIQRHFLKSVRQTMGINMRHPTVNREGIPYIARKLLGLC